MLQFFESLLKLVSLILGIGDSQNFPPPLEKEEEDALFEKAEAGDSSARAKLIEHNLRLVAHIVRKYYASYSDPDELLSIGSLGLMKAVDSFRPKFGTRFATYGAKCVQNEILMFFRSQKKMQNEVSLSDTVDVDRDGNPLTYMDIIATEEDMTDEIDLASHTERVKKLIETVLDRREREIIILRYGLSGRRALTQRETAKHLGISRSYVSRIEKHALEKMKESFGSERPDFGN